MEPGATRATEVERTEALFRQLRDTPDGPERHRLLDEVVVLNLPWARRLAMRYSQRGMASDDLGQVAALALLKAAHGYDPDRGTAFGAYAAPTITGELKRHFRDSGWAVRPPRRLQELRAQLVGSTQRLSQTMGRSPTVAELAEHLGVDQDDVIESMVASGGYSTSSLDAPVGEDTDTWVRFLREDDADMDATPDRLSLEHLLARLPERERRILALRFFADKTQVEIGVEVGVTQMQVSRLLAQSLARLREQLDGATDDEDAAAPEEPHGRARVRSAARQRARPSR